MSESVLREAALSRLGSPSSFPASSRSPGTDEIQIGVKGRRCHANGDSLASHAVEPVNIKGVVARNHAAKGLPKLDGGRVKCLALIRQGAAAGVDEARLAYGRRARWLNREIGEITLSWQRELDLAEQRTAAHFNRQRKINRRRLLRAGILIPDLDLVDARTHAAGVANRYAKLARQSRQAHS